jgi:L-glyceraldehyde 3-phosphate reductase
VKDLADVHSSVDQFELSPLLLFAPATKKQSIPNELSFPSSFTRLDGNSSMPPFELGQGITMTYMAEDVPNSDVPFTHDPWVAARERYDAMPYRRVGSSGLLLPAISLGLWYNFGDDRPFDGQRQVLRHAFDHGITHFDLANNYGPPYGSAEENFGRMLRRDFKPYRNELIISTKAGWDMWPGPYGELGGRVYLLASLDESLDRLGLDYVDIFYSHRIDPVTPLAETIGALDTAVRAGKARYVGISSYSATKTAEAAAIARQLGTPLVIHQPSYSLLNRWIEGGLTTELANAGMGAIAFTALAQGLLTDRYLRQPAADVERATTRPTFDADLVTDDVREQLRGLASIAERRGQSLAQLALAWVLRDPTVASTLIGASSVAQLDENLGALTHLDFAPDELAEIDQFASDSGIDLWRESSDV